jgi:hypothetical protein
LTVTARRWLGTKNHSSPKTRLLKDKDIVYTSEERAWLDAHKFELASVKDDDSDSDHEAETARATKTPRSNECPVCHVGRLKRIRANFRQCEACGVSMPWRYPRPKRRTAMICIDKVRKADRHKLATPGVTSLEVEYRHCGACTRCSAPVTLRVESFARGVALGVDRDDVPSIEARYVAGCTNGHRKYEPHATWTIADEIESAEEERRVERARLEATWEWAVTGTSRDRGRLVNLIEAERKLSLLDVQFIKDGRDLTPGEVAELIRTDREAARSIEIRLLWNGHDLTPARKTIFTAAERGRGLARPGVRPLLYVGTERGRDYLRRLDALSKVRRKAQEAVAALGTRLGKRAPADLLARDVITRSDLAVELGDIARPAGALYADPMMLTRASARYHRRWCRERLADERRVPAPHVDRWPVFRLLQRDRLHGGEYGAVPGVAP